jgi:hypothetical protein
MNDRVKNAKAEHHWLIVERAENWEADRSNGFSHFGLPPRYKSISSEIAVGDVVYCYVSSSISAFSDIRIVRDAGVKKLKLDSFEDIYNRNFAYYFTTSPVLVLPRERWVPLSQLVSVLELTKDRTRLGRRAVFQTSIRRLSPADAALLADVMEEVAGREDRAPSHERGWEQR